MDCFLVSRGIKTLAVRMKQHDANGMTVATFLEDHPRVKRVLYPGLPSHPQHDVAVRQQRGFGAMISFDVGTMEAARTASQSREAVLARGKPGRSGNADLASGDDDARVGPAGDAAGSRHHRRADAHLRGNRRRGRS